MLNSLCAIHMASNINHKVEAFLGNDTKSMHLKSLQERFMNVDYNSSQQKGQRSVYLIKIILGAQGIDFNCM